MALPDVKSVMCSRKYSVRLAIVIQTQRLIGRESLTLLQHSGLGWCKVVVAKLLLLAVRNLVHVLAQIFQSCFVQALIVWEF